MHEENITKSILLVCLELNNEKGFRCIFVKTKQTNKNFIFFMSSIWRQDPHYVAYHKPVQKTQQSQSDSDTGRSPTKELICLAPAWSSGAWEFKVQGINSRQWQIITQISQYKTQCTQTNQKSNNFLPALGNSQWNIQ